MPRSLMDIVFSLVIGIVCLSLLGHLEEVHARRARAQSNETRRNLWLRDGKVLITTLHVDYRFKIATACISLVSASLTRTPLHIPKWQFKHNSVCCCCCLRAVIVRAEWSEKWAFVKNATHINNNQLLLLLHWDYSAMFVSLPHSSETRPKVLSLN